MVRDGNLLDGMGVGGIMGAYSEYVRHLYWKYESQLDGFDKDVMWNGCIPSGAPLTEEEEAECARLWEADFELGLVD